MENTETTQDTNSLGQKASSGPMPDLEQKLREQVAEDLKNKLSEFHDPKKGLRIMSSYMGIHEKTLRRLMDCQNKPGYQTLFKIYKALFNSQSNNEVIGQAPEIVGHFLKQSFQQSKKVSELVDFTLDIDDEIRRDPIFCEIYFLSAAGDLSKEYIGYQYGSYGLNILEKMLEQRVLISTRKNMYVSGPNRASLTPETLHRAGLHLAKQFQKPELTDIPNENHLALYVTGLTEEAYKEWLAVDEEAVKKKTAIAQDKSNIGDHKVYTYMSTGTLRPSTSKKGILH